MKLTPGASTGSARLCEPPPTPEAFEPSRRTPSSWWLQKLQSSLAVEGELRLPQVERADPLDNEQQSDTDCIKLGHNVTDAANWPENEG